MGAVIGSANGVSKPRSSIMLIFPTTIHCIGKRGKPTEKFRMVGQVALQAADFARLPQTVWETITLRPTERGQLQVEFARYRVWTVTSVGMVREETLLLKREGPTIRYSLTNASPS